MLTLKKYLAVVAILAAAAFTSATRPAGAVVFFDFAAQCQSCPPAFGGTGTPIDVFGALELDFNVGDAGLANGEIFGADKIISFNLTFNPGSAVGPGTQKFVEYLPAYTNIAGFSNQFGVQDGALSIAQLHIFSASHKINGVESADDLFFEASTGSDVQENNFFVGGPNKTDFGGGEPPRILFKVRSATVPEPSGLITLLGSIVLLTLVRRRAGAAPLRG